MDKLIISACICGAEVTKEQNPAVPYTVEEIVREAKSAYDAGAALIHLHVRWDDGTPTQDTARFQECIDAIRKGVKTVTILDGRVPHALLIEMLTNEGAGTMVVEELNK